MNKKQKTLKQILNKKMEKEKRFIRYLTNDEIEACIREWLQQKLENYKKATICKTYTEGLNELLDELKKEKQKVE